MSDSPGMQDLFGADETMPPVSGACVFLGLDGDPTTRALIATSSHRCLVNGMDRIGLEHQNRFCLTTDHQSCPVFLAGERTEAAKLPISARSGAGSRNRLVISAVAGAVVALAVGAALILTSDTDEAAKGEVLGDVAQVTPATATAAPSATRMVAAQIATQAPSPTSVPLTATTAPPTPTPSPLPPTEHVVLAGETLSGIAAQNGLTVEELAAANGIPATTLLFAGDTLVIPPASALPPPP